MDVEFHHPMLSGVITTDVVALRRAIPHPSLPLQPGNRTQYQSETEALTTQTSDTRRNCAGDIVSYADHVPGPDSASDYVMNAFDSELKGAAVKWYSDDQSYPYGSLLYGRPEQVTINDDEYYPYSNPCASDALVDSAVENLADFSLPLTTLPDSSFNSGVYFKGQLTGTGTENGRVVFDASFFSALVGQRCVDPDVAPWHATPEDMGPCDWPGLDYVLEKAGDTAWQRQYATQNDVAGVLTVRIGRASDSYSSPTQWMTKIVPLPLQSSYIGSVASSAIDVGNDPRGDLLTLVEVHLVTHGAAAHFSQNGRALVSRELYGIMYQYLSKVSWYDPPVVSLPLVPP
ncbi:MAG: hypothetical protein ACYDCK_03060 [Thermoplasmatota archaeon]